ncbi:hypothetical protein Rsub_10448 [Raphidocelis subcapitata]|uniref:Uncharacterized protein n=1 Tax=Raphidocelis subcapitata TaxID=307507 RepID=A0A2V0PKG1_9CHLO|nr:hypothetical protein Rsub_10448 [Raphidocelis subcapitata]|eukprot:GBF97525.1 hypothetical protein Rsub_10448 [Raphidocelis subcapitata]
MVDTATKTAPPAEQQQQEQQPQQQQLPPHHQRGSSASGSEDPRSPAPLGLGPTTHMAYLIEQCRPCVLRPFCFFVSWQGVLTLAFTGFPPALVTLKDDVSSFYSCLPRENPGSRWPKATLGALRDGRRLTPQELAALKDVCRGCSGIFQTPGQPKRQAVLVDRLAAVVYECRSLERQISKAVVVMRAGRGAPGGEAAAFGGGNAADIDVSEPTAEERARVDRIVSEQDEEDYWFHASKDGNRESHYRDAALGATLVHELSCFGGSGGPAPADGRYSGALPAILGTFRARVDAALPGAYAWFSEPSLHVTIRGLI